MLLIGARNEPAATLNVCNKDRGGRPRTTIDIIHRNRVDNSLEDIVA